jgi:hypothetical protein
VEAITYGLHALEVFAHKFYELLVLQMSGCGDDEIPGREPLLIKIQDWWPLESLDGITGTQ